MGQVWYLIVSIPDLCTITYFHSEWDLPDPNDTTVATMAAKLESLRRVLPDHNHSLE